MNTVPFTRVAGVLPVHLFLEKLGAPAERIAGKVGLSTASYDRLDAFVPYLPASRFYAAAARAEGIENLGALVGLSHPLWDIGAYGQALRRSATLYDLARSAVVLGPKFSSAIDYWIHEDGPRIWFCQRFLGGADYDGSDQVDAYALARVIRGVRDVVDPEWRPQRVRFPARARAALRGVGAWEDARVDFLEDFSAVAIPRRFLARAVPGARGDTPNNAKADPPMESPPSSLLDSVSLVVRILAAEGAPSLMRVSDAMGTSTRSLQRRLAESGATFSEVAARSRLTRARELLQDPAVKIIDVGFELGYSDPANFTRAFRRWTGVSPREYRRGMAGT